MEKVKISKPSSVSLSVVSSVCSLHFLNSSLCLNYWKTCSIPSISGVGETGRLPLEAETVSTPVRARQVSGCAAGLFCLCSGDVSVGIKWDSSTDGDQEADVDFDIIPNANDTFTVKYVPPAAGRLTVKVMFTDQVRAKL